MVRKNVIDRYSATELSIWVWLLADSAGGKYVSAAGALRRLCAEHRRLGDGRGAFKNNIYRRCQNWADTTETDSRSGEWGSWHAVRARKLAAFNEKLSVFGTKKGHGVPLM